MVVEEEVGDYEYRVDSPREQEGRGEERERVRVEESMWLRRREGQDKSKQDKTR